MHKLPALLLTVTLLLMGCATAPAVQVAPICPRLPALDQPAAAQEPSFIERTVNFLSGKLKELTDSEPISPNAKLPTIKPEQP